MPRNPASTTRTTRTAPTPIPSGIHSLAVPRPARSMPDGLAATSRWSKKGPGRGWRSAIRASLRKNPPGGRGLGVCQSRAPPGAGQLWARTRPDHHCRRLRVNRRRVGSTVRAMANCSPIAQDSAENGVNGGVEEGPRSYARVTKLETGRNFVLAQPRVPLRQQGRNGP